MSTKIVAYGSWYTGGQLEVQFVTDKSCSRWLFQMKQKLVQCIVIANIVCKYCIVASCRNIKEYAVPFNVTVTYFINDLNK